METKLVIDGTPISELGIYLLEGSYDTLLQYPNMKSVTTNDWAEYDGLEPDLFNPTLDKRAVTLNFYAKGEYQYEKFLDFLRKSEYRNMFFPDLGMTFQMRLNANSIDTNEVSHQAFSLTFFDDKPYITDAPFSPQNWAKETELTLDDTNLSMWGISVLEGSIQSLVHIPNTKQRLLVSEVSQMGALYDVKGEPKGAGDNATIHLLIRAENVPTLLRNYYGFLAFWVRPHERKMVLTRKFPLYKVYDLISCYYVGQKVNDVWLNPLSSGMVAIQFDLNIAITEKSNKINYYLVVDNGEYYLVDNNNVKLFNG